MEGATEKTYTIEVNNATHSKFSDPPNEQLFLTGDKSSDNPSNHMALQINAALANETTTRSDTQNEPLLLHQPAFVSTRSYNPLNAQFFNKVSMIKKNSNMVVNQRMRLKVDGKNKQEGAQLAEQARSKREAGNARRQSHADSSKPGHEEKEGQKAVNQREQQPTPHNDQAKTGKS